MASLFRIGIQVGATLAGGFMTTFSSVRSTLAGLSTTTDYLTQRHQRLGNIMAQSLSHPLRNLQTLREQYDRLGNTLTTLQRRHEQLTASLARGEALRQDRQRMSGEIISTVATAAAVAMPVLGAVKQASTFEANVRDIAITGRLSREQEARVADLIRVAALKHNQPHAAVSLGVNTMVQQGMDAIKAGKMASLLAQTATATNASVDDLAKMMFSFEGRLQIKGEQAMKDALNRAATGAQMGAFEFKDMAAFMPEFAAQFAARGITGQNAVSQIVASLETTREGAGSSSEAATYMRNWMSHMNAQHTTDEFRKAGVDYHASMAQHVAAGMNQYEASLLISQKFIEDRGAVFMKQWQAADGRGDRAAMEALMQSFGLGEVFRDIQTISHLINMRQGWGKYKNIQEQMGSSQALQTIDSGAANRMDTAQKNWSRFTINAADLGITIGNILLPSLNAALDALRPMVTSFAQFSDAHPGLIKGVISFAGGIVGMKLAALGLGWALNFFILSPINSVRTGIITLMSRWTMLRAIFLMGGGRVPFLLQLMGLSKLPAMLARLAVWFRSFGAMLLTVGRALLPFAKGLLMGVLGPIKLLGQGVLWFGRLLGGSLLAGLKLVGHAVIWLGRALLMNPIGLVITAIALGAYLIYRNWDKLKPYFTKLWSSVRAVTASAWAGLKSLFFTWHPLGILIKNWQPITTWFSSLPAKFKAFGGDIITGLTEGLVSFANKPLETITNMGAAMRDQFKQVLGIRSPSRVFASLGLAVSEGAAAGIHNGRGLAVGAVAGLALASTAAWGNPQLALAGPLAQASAKLGSSPGSGPGWVQHLQPLNRALQQQEQAQAGGALNIHFAPNITITASDPAAVKDQVGQAMAMSFTEFERMMARYQRDTSRRNYEGR